MNCAIHQVTLGNIVDFNGLSNPYEDLKYIPSSKQAPESVCLQALFPATPLTSQVCPVCLVD